MGSLRLCGGVLHLCPGLDILKIDKNYTDLQYSVSCFILGELGALFEGAKPIAAPRGDGTGCDIFTQDLWWQAVGT